MPRLLLFPIRFIVEVDSRQIDFRDSWYRCWNYNRDGDDPDVGSCGGGGSGVDEVGAGSTSADSAVAGANRHDSN